MPENPPSEVVVVATLTPQPGKTDEVVEVFSGLLAQVHAQEPGCRLYALHRHEDGRLVVIEKYDDAASLAAHGASDHFRAAGAQLAGLLAGAPQVEVLAPVPLGDAGKGRL